MLDLGTVPTVWYLLFFMLDLGTVPTVWYLLFFMLDLGTVPTVWYVLFFILFQALVLFTFVLMINEKVCSLMFKKLSLNSFSYKN